MKMTKMTDPAPTLVILGSLVMAQKRKEALAKYSLPDSLLRQVQFVQQNYFTVQDTQTGSGMGCLDETHLPDETLTCIVRYIHRDERRSALILTDGACLNNGQPNPRAGWAFVHGMGLSGEPAIVSNRLENKGPFGDEGVQSSNRAELRAVIAALRFRHWPGEGIRTMTIATDSEYVVEGSTKWARTWVNNGWKTNANADVKNRDLWEMLLGEVEKWDDAGLSIRFWRIPREWNETADAAAKNAASEDTSYEEWVDVKGF